MLREILARFTVDADTSKLDKAGSKVEGFTDRLREVGGALVATEIADRVKGFVLDMVDLGDGIAATADKLGMGTTELQQWGLAAQLSDVDTEAFNGAVVKLQKNMADAAEGGGAAGDVFKSLGVELKDANGKIRATPAVMLDVARGIAEIEEPAVRTQKLMAIFGKQGAALGPMFSRGAEGLEELLGELERTGGGLSEEAIAAMAGLDDATIKYDASVTALKGKLALAIMPTITRVVDSVTRLTGAFSNTEGSTRLLASAMGVLGTAGAIAGLKMIAPYLPLIALIVGATLVVDDLTTALEGGDSVTGRLLDKIFGEGSGDAVFKDIKADVDALKKRLDTTPGAAGKIGEAFSTVGASVVRFFVDDLNEAFDIASARIASGKGEFADYAIAMAASLNPASLPANVVATYNKIKAALDEFIAGQKAQWRKMGLDIPDDIWKGIKDGMADLLTNIGDLGDKMVDAIKDKFKNFELPSLPGVAPGAVVPTSLGSKTPAGGGTTYASNTSSNRIDSKPTVNVYVQGDNADAVRRGVLGGMREANEELVHALEATVAVPA